MWHLKKKRPTKGKSEMCYKVDFDADTFEWWSGARDTVDRIRNAGLMDAFQEHLEEVFGMYDDMPSDTDLNDYVWFEADSIYAAIGLADEDEEDTDEDTDEDE